jgi:Cu/Ag efflux protein CusF
MRKVAVLMVAVLVAGLMLLGATPATAAGKTHDLTGTVVSADVAAKKLTFKDDTGTSMTSPVLDSAMASLKKVKAGEHVTLTCQDNEQGDHQGISKIVVAAAAKKK